MPKPKNNFVWIVTILFALVCIGYALLHKPEYKRPPEPNYIEYDEPNLEKEIK